ncbi:uncharacterized protein At2g39920-like [Arachis stenosperma]|uniref:uncharacterized protein At2g39920-like n=1 Tax=Arachis stenosperma TaxID=217475 RepID=UPI0025AC77F8|nr:uncharacterized protein At2g39920-like [Arachis stenosperma]
MSTNGHQMEQQYSTRNLSDSSESGSHYELESRFYMTSCTAIIFVASLVTVGVLLITLVVSLTIMLQSCQSKSSGVIRLQNVNDYYIYCKMHFLHAELNNLEGNYLPNICRDLAINYVKEGQYGRDMELASSMIDDYFNSVKSSDHGLDSVLMDIDNIFAMNPHSSNLFHRFQNDNISNCIKEAKNLKLRLLLRLYLNLQTAGWSIILLSRESETQRNNTSNHLVSAGFRGWSALLMRKKDEVSAKENEYFYRQRNLIQKKGFRIKSIISSHVDALKFLDKGMQILLLPNPMCHKF